MRDSNENMIELIDVSKSDDVYSSIISHKIADKVLKLRFGINLEDYVHLKRILEFRPFDNTGVAPYRYFLLCHTEGTTTMRILAIWQCVLSNLTETNNMSSRFQECILQTFFGSTH